MHRLGFLLILAVAFSGCGGSDSGGSPAAPSTPTTPTPPPVTVTAVNVTGADCGGSTCNITTMGGTAQLTATATKSDGTTQDVSSLATWNSTSTVIASVNSSGLVTAKVPGTCDVTAVYQSKMGGQTINVNPPIWSKTGGGNSVFDMPTYIRRVRIWGLWDGRSTSNFIVRIGGSTVVNAILRYGNPYEGVHLTNGGVVSITSSEGVKEWRFTEER